MNLDAASSAVDECWIVDYRITSDNNTDGFCQYDFSRDPNPSSLIMIGKSNIQQKDVLFS
jgi:hypothetical protein